MMHGMTKRIKHFESTRVETIMIKTSIPGTFSFLISGDMFLRIDNHNVKWIFYFGATPSR